MSDLEKDNHENEEDGDYMLEPIIPIINDDDDYNIYEKTDEEISLHSLEKKPNKPPSRAPSIVWQYYEKIFDDQGNCISIKCNYCDQKYSSKSSTTTLNDHWTRRHSKVQPGGVGSIEAAFGNKSQTTCTKLQGDEYLVHFNKLVKWVIRDSQSFRVVDSFEFRDFLIGLNPRFQVPSRQTIRKKIGDRYEQYKKDIIKLFQVNFILNYLVLFKIIIT